MKITHKMLLTLLAPVLMVVLVGFFALTASQKALQKTIIENTQHLAVEILDKMGRDIYGKIETFQAYTKDLILQEAVEKSNEDFAALADSKAYVDRKEQEWSAVPREIRTPFMEGLLENKLVDELREKMEFYEAKYGYHVFAEVLVTNKYGANIAQTRKVARYRQDEEPWWRDAKENGFSVQEIVYDERTGNYFIDLGIKIEDEDGRFVGVMKVVMNAEGVISILKNMESSSRLEGHATTHYTLATQDARLIYSTRPMTIFADVTSLLPDSEYFEGDHTSYVIRGDSRSSEGQELSMHSHSKGYRDYKGAGWILIIEHAAKEVFAPVTELRNRILLASLVLAIIGALLGIIIARSISQPIEKLASMATEIGKGNLNTRLEVKSQDEIGYLTNSFNTMSSSLQKLHADSERTNEELQQEIIERNRREEQLKTILKEKELLLKEIHHRVKNNMQVVSSLLKLQARKIKDKKLSDILEESQNRIRAMALIHENIYSSGDLGKIKFYGYITDLTTGLFSLYRPDTGQISLQVDSSDDATVNIETAIPCGLIINELVTNSLKYGFPEGKSGEISILFNQSGEDQLTLTVSDNGIGIPKDIDFRNTGSLGLHLVTMLAEDQLDGEINLDRSAGTEFKIQFRGKS